ncbi:hypothetical protein FB45DRAFT_757565 [Roridomyces roridus]|uniref:SWIM-type domain-containing protein n=1 Tax=Roridomyces roridus TaxID=1738132 RepID=A0AAD7FEL5_9AGAR|nr:hypothetical protein FB45DRAFT_757565 [Roridomyces roridus]
MINAFEDDRVYISTKWFMDLIQQRGLRVKHLIRVIHRTTSTAHYVVLLSDGRYLCDCCMGTNLGLTCRHFFTLWIAIQDLPFHLSLIRARWYQNPDVDLGTIPAVTKQRAIQRDHIRIDFARIPNPDFGLTSPLKLTKEPTLSKKSSSATETLPARDVFHEIQSSLRPLLNGVETREQVDELLSSLGEIMYGMTFCN